MAEGVGGGGVGGEVVVGTGGGEGGVIIDEFWERAGYEIYDTPAASWHALGITCRIKAMKGFIFFVTMMWAFQ